MYVTLHVWICRSWSGKLFRACGAAMSTASCRHRFSSLYSNCFAALVHNMTSICLLMFQSGWVGLQDDLARLAGGPPSSLVWPLAGGDPDDYFSRVPYEKVGRYVMELLWFCGSRSVPMQMVLSDLRYVVLKPVVVVRASTCCTTSKGWSGPLPSNRL